MHGFKKTITVNSYIGTTTKPFFMGEKIIKREEKGTKETKASSQRNQKLTTKS